MEEITHDHKVAAQRMESRHAAVVEEHNLAIEAIHTKHRESLDLPPRENLIFTIIIKNR